MFLSYRYHLEHVNIVWLPDDFRHHQLVLSVGSFRRQAIFTASRTKGCMVLTRSMATTTNNQGNKLRTTALERQVQTLTATVERLTKQNHDLEEQLRQKIGALNTQEEDQEGTNTERRNQERLEGSNAPSRPKR